MSTFVPTRPHPEESPRVRATRLALPLAALLALPVTLAPAAQAVQQESVPCGFDEVCFYAEPTAQGEIVHRVRMTVGWGWNERDEWHVQEIEFADEEVIDPAFTANSVRTPIPAVHDCGIVVFSEEEFGGDSQWASGPMTNLALNSEIRSLMMDCG